MDRHSASLSFPDEEVGFDALGGMDFDDVLEEAVHGVADLPPLPNADLEMMDCAGGVGGGSEDVIGSGGVPPLPPLPDCGVPPSLLGFKSADAGVEEESDSSASSSSEEESDDDEDDGVNDENAHLSDYERLRLANIKRNEARLARLGLLTTNGTSALGSMGNNDKKKIPPKQKKKPGAIIPKRSLPRRRCNRIKKLNQGGDAVSSSLWGGRANVSTKRERRVLASKRSANGYSRSLHQPHMATILYDSDESTLPPAIVPDRVLKPQLHQGDKPFDGSTDGQVRRNRRGRPKKSDYFFTCDERCKMCGGGWVIDNGGTDPSVATNDFAAEARRKMERDTAARDLEQRTMLFRCKGCQGAFHIECMIKYGKEEADASVAISAVTEEMSSGDFAAVPRGVEPASIFQREDSKPSALFEDKGSRPAPLFEGDGRTPFEGTGSVPVALFENAGSELADVSAGDDSKPGAVFANAGCTSKPGATLLTETAVPFVGDRGIETAEPVHVPAEFLKPSLTTVEISKHMSAYQNTDYSHCQPKRCYACELNNLLNPKPKRERMVLAYGQESDEDEQKDEMDVHHMQPDSSKTVARAGVVASSSCIDPDGRYDCPFPGCNKTNLTKMGLSAHHGMKHGGKIDWSKVKRTRQSADDCRSTSGTLPILEATVNGRKVLVRVTPEPLLEAAKGVEVRVILGGKSFEGDNYEDPAVIDESNAIDRATETRIKKALTSMKDDKFVSSSIETLRKWLYSVTAMATVVQLGGVTLCSTALSLHLSRSMVQAEAMCTLAEVAWACPNLGFQTVTEGCLDLVVSGMSAHTENGMVQLHGLGYLRALSYDPALCKKLSKGPILMCAVDAIRNNHEKLSVCVEASMFLQNMTVVSQSSTVKCILKQPKNDERPKVLPALIAMTKSNYTDTSSTVNIFGLLINVSLHSKGANKLRNLGFNVEEARRKMERDEALRYV